MLSTRRSLHRIGNVLQKMNEFDKALEHYKSSIDMAVRIRGVGVDHAGIAYSLHDSGIVLQQLGDLDGALSKYVLIHTIITVSTTFCN